ncbi:MAG: TIGR04133 family radical SAM/SPASM protein [Treponema sp.]|nr:TIGR04133 family radical SAM/SPASM protein [Treponema sp.]
MKDILRREVFRLYRHCVVKEHSLDYLFWECTRRCNLNCRHCGSDCSKEANVPDMPLADFEKVLDGIKEKNPNKNMTVCVTGGEPLLRKDLEAAGVEIRKRGFNWTLVSNGLAMTRERFDALIRSGLGGMSLSIDGLEKEHCYLRQNKKSFESVVSAIERCVERHEKYPRLFLFDVITCVHAGNIDALPKLRDFLIEKGVEFWRLFCIFPSGRAAEASLSLNSEQYRRLMGFIIETRSYKNKDGKSIFASHSCEGYLGPYELKVRNYFFFCRSGVNIGSVMCDGSITGCLSVRSPDFFQGNIYKDDFMDVWNERFKNMRDRSWTKTGICERCKSWRWCEGNGLHLHNDARSACAYCNLRILEE